MAGSHLKSFEELKEQFKRLPGIGSRSAERIAFHLLRCPKEDVEGLAASLLNLRSAIRHCSTCFNLTESDPCPLCVNPHRDPKEIWVVEQPDDVMTLESTGLIKGVYHVLMGHIAPLDGVEPGDVTIDELIERARRVEAREVILALNPTLEGDGTAMHIQSLLADLGIRTTRPARGLAVGSQLGHSNQNMLQAAISGRSAF